MLPTFTAGIVVMLVSLVGVLATWKALERWMTRNLHYLISFAAGVFFLVALDLTLEVSELVIRIEALAFVIGGIFLFMVFGQLVPESHHHHEPGDRLDSHTSTRGSRRILLADAIHNVADGIILVPAFAFSTELGIAVTIGILIHEAIQEISEFFVLKEAGYTTKEAILWNFLVSGFILVGIAIGLMLSQVEGLEPALLGIAAGGFFYVVFVDLLPRSFKVCKTKYCRTSHVVWAVVGVLAMWGVGYVVEPLHLHGTAMQHEGHIEGQMEHADGEEGHEERSRN